MGIISSRAMVASLRGVFNRKAPATTLPVHATGRSNVPHSDTVNELENTRTKDYQPALCNPLPQWPLTATVTVSSPTR